MRADSEIAATEGEALAACLERWRTSNVPYDPEGEFLLLVEPGDTLDLAALGAPEALATQHFVNIRTVIKKLGQRIQLLREGHSPEALKLGRVLSAPAAARLLQYLDSRFRPQAPSATSSEQGEFDLVYGGDSAYMLLTNSALNVVDEVGAATKEAGEVWSFTTTEAFTLTGSANADALVVGLGIDAINGGAGADRIAGGGGVSSKTVGGAFSARIFLRAA